MSSVYIEKDGSEDFVADYIKEIIINENNIVLIDVMGKQTDLTGTIKNIDLVKNTILIGGN